MFTIEEEIVSESTDGGSPPYALAARFPDERSAGRAYQAAQALLFTAACDLSAFRFFVGPTWYVAIVGELPAADLDQRLHAIFTGGLITDLPADVLVTLLLHPSAYAMDLRAGDVIAVLDELGVEQTHYLGYSMGGRIGFDTAKLAPTRLCSLLIGGATPYAADNQSQRTQMFSGGMEAMLERQPLPAGVKTTAFRAAMLANDVEALIASAIDRPSVEEILPTLTMPCLLYAGEADGSHARIKQCASLIPDATFASLPNLDHWAGIYRSDIVLPHIRAFLNRVIQQASAR